MKKAAKHKEMLSPQEYAELNGVSTMTVYRSLWDGLIPEAVKIRAQWRIPSDAALIQTSRGNKKAVPDSIAASDMPKELTINGVLYVRADSVM